jgi:DNA polymerase III sliding clamp (beta) subunit (PCNA family)
MPALTCVLLDIDDDVVTLVATDRHRLAMRVLPGVGELGRSARALVPAAQLARAGARAARCTTVRLHVAGERAELELGDERQLLGTAQAFFFPDYRSIVDGLGPVAARAMVDRRALLELLVDGELPPVVEISMGGDELRCTAPNGAGVVALPAICTGEIRVGFATSVLAAAVDSSIGTDVLLEVTAPGCAVVVRSADQGAFTTLAMPIVLAQAA